MSFSDFLDSMNRKKRDEERAKTAMKFAIGMGIAATIGVVRGILFAPKAGSETREELKKKAVNAVETIKTKVRRKAEALRVSTAQAAQEIHDAMSPKNPKAAKK